MAIRKQLKNWWKLNFKESIKNKYTLYMVIGVLLTSLMVGGGCIILTNKKENEDTKKIMNLHCQNVAANINEALSSTEQSVKFMSEYIYSTTPDIETLLQEPETFDAYNNQVITIFDKITHQTKGAVTYYYRYNIEYFPSTAGFLRSREYSHQDLGKNFVQLEPTDLKTYSKDDKKVSWYYHPIATGKGEWIPPYWGENLQMNMISYVKPIRKNEITIGVIGMDIDFDILMNEIKEKKLYESGHTFLISEDKTSVLDENATKRKDENDETIEEIKQFKDKIKKDDSNSQIAYKYNNIEKEMVHKKLNNGMYLVYVANKKDIYKEQNLLVKISIILGIIIALVCAFIGYQSTKKLTDPLEKLTDAAIQLGDGNINIKIPPVKINDEVGKLTTAFQKTTDHLQNYITYVQNLAYKDALTDVQNRTAYEKLMEQIGIDIRLGRAEFALIMIDLNQLKTINDTYGHEMGNHYICNLCNKITAIFPVETVYRIGGDEFIIVLKDKIYEKRNELLIKIRKELDYKEKEDILNPWENVTAAAGMAEFNPQTDDSPETVFKRADQEMYEHKIQMKREME